jgi:glutathione peroxidase
MSQTLAEIPVARIDGTPSSLGAFAGKVLLVVNVASECGLTPQYEGLQKLYAAKRGAGLEILGFPANNFGAQEPGTEAQIQAFCTANFGVEFPLFKKISVGGKDRHPLYSALIAAQPKIQGSAEKADPEITWNFEKFLIGRDGKVLARFAPETTPEDPKLLQAIEAALA